MRIIIINLVIIFITIITVSCMRNTTNELTNYDDLYAEMLNEYNKIYSEVSIYMDTISDIEYDKKRLHTRSNDNADINALEPWMQRHIGPYLSPNNILEFNETDAIKNIASDNSLTKEQKTFLAKSISYGYYIKTRIKEITVNTRATKQECLDAFNKAALRIVRNFAISGSLGILTGGLGTVAAGVVAYISIDEAEKDYNKCMKTAK